MGSDLWNHSKFLHHKVRNMVRRGYLTKTYYDKKIMQAKIKTGVKMENDRIDIVQPVGYLGRVKPSEKAEVITMDVGGDTSRRVVIGVMGDRESHPKIKEGESILYSPGDQNNFLRVYKKPKDDGGGGKAGEEGGEDGGGKEDSPDSKEAIYGKYGETFCLFDGKKAQTYYKDEKKSTQCDDEHVHIRYDDFRIWIDKKGLWSTKPILIKQDPDSGSRAAYEAAREGEEPPAYDWIESTNTWIYNAKMQFNADVELMHVKGENAKQPMLTLADDPKEEMHAVTKRYVDSSASGLASKVDKAGDTMTGYLTLNDNPADNLHAATRSYVDGGDATLTAVDNYLQSQIIDRVLKIGDSMSGPLYLFGAPTSAYMATPMFWVEGAIADAIAAIPPAPPAARAGETIEGDQHFAGNVTFTGNVVIEGDLIVRGRIIEG